MAHTPPEPERLTDEQVRHVAKLARLALDDTEVAAHRQTLAATLAYVRRISQLDLDDVEPLVHIGIEEGETANTLADDIPGESLTPDAVRALAPDAFTDPQPDGSEHVYIRVPKVLGEGGGA